MIPLHPKGAQEDVLDVVISSMSRETFLLVGLEYHISHVLGSIPSSAGATVERISSIFCSLLYIRHARLQLP